MSYLNKRSSCFLNRRHIRSRSSSLSSSFREIMRQVILVVVHVAAVVFLRNGVTPCCGCDNITNGFPGDSAYEYYSTWTELALAIQTTRVEIIGTNCSNVQLTFRIQPNSTLDATQTTIHPPTPSSSSPSIVSPETSTTPENYIPVSPSPTSSYITSSHSYDYGSSRRVRGSISSDTFRRATVTAAAAPETVAVDIDEIIREVESESRLTSPRSNDHTNGLTTSTQPPLHASTTTPSSTPTPPYNDDIVSRTAITIQPWDMILLSNHTINEITYSTLSHNNDTLYTSFGPITIQIIIQCGDFGTIQDDCIIHGGDTHFVIDVTLLQKSYNTTPHHPSLFLPLFNIQTTIEFRGITMQSAKDTSILLYHSSGYIYFWNTVAFNHTTYTTRLPTLHQVTIRFHDCFWEQNYGNYGAVLDVYKDEEGNSNPLNKHDDDNATVVALYQLSVKFQRCIFDNNFSKEGSAVLIENTDTTNSLITVKDSLFVNSAQSGAIRATFTTNNNTLITARKENESSVVSSAQPMVVSPQDDFNVGLIIMDSCFIGNINSISQGTIFVEYPYNQRGNFIVTSNNNYGQNNMVGTIEEYDNNFNWTYHHPSCSSLFIHTIPWTNEDNKITYHKEQCMEFDTTTEIESCQLLKNLPVELSLAPTPSPSNLNFSCSDGITVGYSSWIPLTEAIENSLGNEIFILCPNTGTFLLTCV